MVVADDEGRIVPELSLAIMARWRGCGGDAGPSPKSVREDPLSLWRRRRALARVDEASESLYKVAESVVEIEVLGELGRGYAEVPVASLYARSRSDRCLAILLILRSVPLAVSDGLVMGADITAAGFPLKP